MRTSFRISSIITVIVLYTLPMVAQSETKTKVSKWSFPVSSFYSSSTYNTYDDFSDSEEKTTAIIGVMASAEYTVLKQWSLRGGFQVQSLLNNTHNTVNNFIMIKHNAIEQGKGPYFGFLYGKSLINYEDFSDIEGGEFIIGYEKKLGDLIPFFIEMNFNWNDYFDETERNYDYSQGIGFKIGIKL